MKYWLDENGQRHVALPRIWNGVTPFNALRAEEAGWQLVDEPDPPPAPPVVYYSKYKLKLACEARNLWEQVKQAIEASGKWESFLLIQDIASDNEELQAVMPSIVATFGQDLVNEVLAESEA